MAKYKIALKETLCNIYVVDADNEEQAMDMICNDFDLFADEQIERWCEGEGEATEDDIKDYGIYEG